MRWISQRYGFGTYINFIKHSIDNDNPLIVSFKLNPSSHTNWRADHVTVVNGYDENGLYILTTWDNNPQIYRTWEQLLSKKHGLGLGPGSRVY